MHNQQSLPSQPYAGAIPPSGPPTTPPSPAPPPAVSTREPRPAHGQYDAFEAEVQKSLMLYPPKPGETPFERSKRHADQIRKEGFCDRRIFRSKYAAQLEALGLPGHVALAASALGLKTTTLKRRLERGTDLKRKLRRRVYRKPDGSVDPTRTRPTDVELCWDFDACYKTYKVRWNDPQIRERNAAERIRQEMILNGIDPDAEFEV